MAEDKKRQIEVIKKWFNNYSYLKKIIQADEEYLNDTEQLTGIAYDGISTAPTNKVNSSVELEMLSRIEKHERLSKNKRQLKELDRALSVLNEFEYKVMKAYYIDDKGWKAISNEINLVPNQCQRKRDCVLEKLRKYFYEKDVA